MNILKITSFANLFFITVSLLVVWKISSDSMQKLQHQSAAITTKQQIFYQTLAALKSTTYQIHASADKMIALGLVDPEKSAKLERSLAELGDKINNLDKQIIPASDQARIASDLAAYTNTFHLLQSALQNNSMENIAALSEKWKLQGSQFILSIDQVKILSAAAEPSLVEQYQKYSAIAMLVILSLALGMQIFLARYLASYWEKFVREMKQMADAHDAGDIDVQMAAEKFKGIFREMAERINYMVFAHIATKKKAMAVVDAFGMGDFEFPFEQLPGKKVFLNEIIERLRKNLQGFMQEMNHMSGEHDLGDIDVRMDAAKFNGEFIRMAEGVNKMVEGHISVKKKAMAVVEQFGKGNLDAPLEVFPGKKKFINDYIETLRENLKRFISDVNLMVANAVDGNLAYRADQSLHQGDYKKIVEGINATLDAVIEPVLEAAGVLSALAEGNLTRYMQGNYKGDHEKIKQALNHTLDSFNEILGGLTIAVDEMKNGAGQISDASQSLSQGSTEQAASVEEISAAVTELASQTRQAAENAKTANSISGSSLESSRKGSEMMSELMVAMREIETAAGDISKIIKAIDEIAFQTNLLSLNAAVEAARAGRHGKGFAVVAEEVKSLSDRSARAARETAELIQESINRANKGAEIASRTVASLDEISQGVEQVASLMTEVSAAAEEQSAGLLQVEKSMQQIESVTQNNAANSEQTASASAELSGQAESISGMIQRFEIRSGLANFSSTKSAKTYSHGMPMAAVKQKVVSHQVIALEDDEFGNY